MTKKKVTTEGKAPATRFEPGDHRADSSPFAEDRQEQPRSAEPLPTFPPGSDGAVAAESTADES